MKDISASNFGLLIAYLLPGFTALWGASAFSPTLQTWLAARPDDAPSVGGFLYLTLGSVAAGLTVSTVRWAVIDTIHHLTGLSRPAWDFRQLQSNIAAYDRLERNHYVYYKFYSNMVVALLYAYAIRQSALTGWADVAIIGLVIVFSAGSRDTLAKYFDRVSHLLGERSPPPRVVQKKKAAAVAQSMPASAKTAVNLTP